MYSLQQRPGRLVIQLMLFIGSAFLLTGCGTGGGTPPPDPIPDSTRAYGAILPSASTVRSAPAALLFGSTGAFPASVTLTSDPALPPIGDQGSVGSCVAWACGYGLTSWESARSSGGNSSSPDRQASAADHYWKILEEMRFPCGSGTDPKLAMDILGRRRVASTSQVPYRTACSLPSSATTFGITGYRVLSPDDTNAFKHALNNNHPVAIAAQTYTDFPDWGIGPNRTGVYTGNGVIQTGGGHMMLVVGYDDNRNAWRIMNSWGTGWGDNGFFWMAYNTFARTVQAGYVAEGGGNVNPPTPGGNVTFTSIAPRQYYSVSMGIYYFVYHFTLSEPLSVTRGRMTYVPTGGTTGWQTVNQVMSSSYFWWTNGNNIPYLTAAPGTYKVELEGKTQDGRTVIVEGTQTLSDGGLIRSGSKSVEVPDSVRPRIDQIKSIPGHTTGLLPGTKAVVNGHIVTLTQK